MAPVCCVPAGSLIKYDVGIYTRVYAMRKKLVRPFASKEITYSVPAVMMDYALANLSLKFARGIDLN